MNGANANPFQSAHNVGLYLKTCSWKGGIKKSRNAPRAS